MKFVSLFSGVGGFDLGLEAAGWECVAQVEWDQHCQAVLARHWPDVPKWHDVSDVLGADLPAADAVVFGSPCQDLSVAGKRAGFDGERSVLFYEAIRIIKEMQDVGRGPAWIVWENVVGALSSSQGRDFAAVLDALADIGALDIAWRVLDARFFGVPQQRRRVFVVADLAGHRAGEVFAEPEGVCWHPHPSLAPWTAAAAATGSGAESGGSPAAAVRQSPNGGLRISHAMPTLLAEAGAGRQAMVMQAHSMDGLPTVVGSLPASLGKGGMGHNKDQLCIPIWAGSAQHEAIAAPLLAGRGGLRTTDIDGGTWVVGPVVPTVDVNGSLQAHMHKGPNAENAADGHLVVANAAQAVSENGRGDLLLTDYSHSLTTGGGKPGQGYPTVLTDVAVRRLTPVECERLMGWPDDHTRWRADGTEVADSHRYHMCGNGVAAVVAQWLGERVSEVQR